MMCGIYGIKNKMNGKMYIGKAKDTADRFIRHRYLLNANKHYNHHLQHAWNKYGANNFEFIILENCGPEKLPELEQKWVDVTQNKYNHVLDVITSSGDTNPFFGKKHTVVAKKKMSLAKAGKYFGENNPNFGVKQPLQVRMKMVANNAHTKLNPQLVLQIKQLLLEGAEHQTIASQFNISRTVVTRISNGTRWANITGGAVTPIVYADGVRRFTDNHRKRMGERRKGMKYKVKEKI